jgi:peptide/nickel transport system permease protein
VFRYALRRALWALPTLLCVSLVVFLVTTLLPDPVNSLPSGTLDEEGAALEARRGRFLDLPMLFNPAPQDIRVRLRDCLAAFQQNAPNVSFCERELARLGGAALPHILPQLDSMPVPVRRKVALALAPVAVRMGRFRTEDFADADRATLFWTNFWEDHAIDFTEFSARRAVDRLLEHGGESRERDLYLLDTYVLRSLMQAFVTTERRDIIVQLSRIISHVTARDGVIADGAPQSLLRARVSEWRAFWLVHEHDFIAFDGAERIVSMLSQTRYAKWMIGALFGELRSVDEDLSIGDRLRKRSLLTFSLVVLATVLAYGIAIPLGAFAAYRKGKAVDRISSLVLLVLYAIPSFGLAQALIAISGNRRAAFFAVLTLALGAVATLTRYQRAAVLEVMSSDYIRTARSKGVFGMRLLVVHALRNAVMPTIALLGVQFPALISGAFVVEEVFGLRGVGWETLRAIEHRDAAWIVTVTFFTAAVATLTLIASDLVHGLLDPRVRETLRRRGG